MKEEKKKKTKKSAVSSKKKPKKNDAKKQVKKNTKKKTRSDHIDVQKQIVNSTFREILPPSHIILFDEEMNFFDSIVQEYAKIEWTDHALEMAAILARYMHQLDEEQKLYKKEGSLVAKKQVIPGKNGEKAKIATVGKIINPRKAIIDTHTKNIIAIRRSLALHARGKDGELRDVQSRRQSAKSIENAVGGIEDDDLIARPPTIQ